MNLILKHAKILQAVGHIAFAFAFCSCGLFTENPVSNTPLPPSDAEEDIADLGEVKDLLCREGAPEKARALLKRLTHAELESSVRNAFGGLSDEQWPAPNLPADRAAANGFSNQADALNVSSAYLEKWISESEKIGEIAAQKRDELTSCTSVSNECREQFLETIGRRLFRRPLTATQKEELLQLTELTSGSEEEKFNQFIKWASVSMLQSPEFLYRTEWPSENNGRLDVYDIAEFLSFTLLRHAPTDDLFDKAKAGILDDKEAVKAIAFEMIAEGGGAQKASIDEFLSRWLGVAELQHLVRPAVLDFNDDVKKDMKEELLAFSLSTLFENEGSIAKFLTSDETHFSEALQAFYGLESAVRLPQWGHGFMALGAVQTVRAHPGSSSPTLRGITVREQVLCDELGPPPPVVGNIPTPTGSETTRERYETHAEFPSCQGCHQYLDPVGFAFEHFDDTGRFRESENGFPIDTSGVLRGFRSGESDVPTTGPLDLMNAVAEKSRSTRCITRQLGAFWLGLDEHEASCLTEDYAQAHHEGRFDFRSLWAELLSSDRFLYRNIENTSMGNAEPEPEDAGNALIPSDAGLEPEPTEPSPEPQDAWATTPDAQVSLINTDRWETGGCVEATVENIGTTALFWVVEVPIEQNITTLWEGDFQVINNTQRVRGKTYNKELQPTEKVVFGYCFSD